MLLAVTFQDILDVLEQYWVLIAFSGGVVWALIKMYFKQQAQGEKIKSIETGQIAQIRDTVKELDVKIDAHDKSDKLMEENLMKLIDRNHAYALNAASSVKDKLDTAAMLHNNKLDTISKGLTTVEAQMNLILDGRIKINMQ